MKSNYTLACASCCVLTTVIIIFALLIGTRHSHAQTLADGTDLSAIATAWIETEQSSASIPGVVAALVVNGEVIMARGFGSSDLETGRLADENTRFRVGSVSKPVTATGALLAMARYGITPTTDLRPYFEDLPIRPALEEPLTFAQLLTQTAGFSESLAGQHVTDETEFLDLSNYLQARLPPRFVNPGQVITQGNRF